MKKIKTGSLFILYFLLYAQVAVAEVTVQSLVDRNAMAVGETFTLEVRITSDRSVPVGQPSLPTIPGVDLINRTQQQESRSSVVSTPQGMDFKNITTNVFRYDFVAQQVGKINIDPITVEVGSEEFKTKPIVLTVGEANMAQQAPRRPTPQQLDPQQDQADPFSQVEEQFNRLLRRHFGGDQAPPGGYQTAYKDKNHAFFVTAEVDKTEAYKGEQITAAWYLYTQGRVRDIDTLQYPTLKGFWKEDIQIATHLNFESEVINGLPYNRALLASYALFPIEEGQQKIDSYKAKATIERGFGFSRNDTQTKASDIIPIIVKPLPTEGRPASFTGAVGQFQLSTTVEERTVVEGQPFTMVVRFDGKGNAKLIELPKLELPNGLELYDIKNEAQFFKNGQSFKKFEVLLIPRMAGEITLPALASSFFDPEKRQYVDLTSEPVVINVLKGTQQDSLGPERLQSKESEKKVLPGPMTEFDPKFQAAGLQLWPWYLLLIMCFLVLWGRAVYELGWLAKSPDLRDELSRRMALIYAKLEQKKYREVGIDMTNCVYHVLGEVSGQGGANVELGKLLSKTAPSIRREIEVPLRKLMDYFGALGFGPASMSQDDRVTGAAKKNIKDLEDLLLKSIKLNRRFDKGEED